MPLLIPPSSSSPEWGTTLGKMGPRKEGWMDGAERTCRLCIESISNLILRFRAISIPAGVP